MKIKPLKIYWVLFMRLFERRQGNGELEFRSLSKFRFDDVHYRELFAYVMKVQSITSSEYIALNQQRLIEIDKELSNRGFSRPDS